MRAKERREKRKKRVASARHRAEQSRFGGFTSLNIPDGVRLLSIETDDQFEIDVLPYKIKDASNNKFAESEDGEPLEPGDEYFERTYYVHKNLGPEQNASYCCPVRTFGKKRCPICEKRAELVKDPDHDEDEVRALLPSERQLFAVVPKAGEKKGEVCIWDVATWNFWKFAKEVIQKSDPEKGYDYFWDPEKGLTLSITPMWEKMPRSKYLRFTNIAFIPRKKPIPESLLDKVPDLDAMPKEISYEELYKIFHMVEDTEEANGKPRKRAKDEEDDEDEEDSELEDSGDEDEEEEDDEDEDEPPKKRKGKQTKASEDEEDDEGEDSELEDDDEDEEDEDEVAGDKGITVGTKVKHKRHGVCTVIKISKDGTSLTLEDEDDEEIKAVGISDVEVLTDDEDEEDEDDDDRPTKKSSSTKSRTDSARKMDDEDEEDSELEDSGDEDEEEEDDEDEDEPPKKRRGRR